MSAIRQVYETAALLIMLLLLFLGGCKADAMEARTEGTEYGIFFTAAEAETLLNALEEANQENEMLRELVRELDLQQIERASTMRICS